MFRWLVFLIICGSVIWFFWPMPARPAKSTPIPAPAPIVSSARLAPEGTFFLTEYISLANEDGIRGFPGGTKVTRLEDLGDSLQVRNSTGTVFKVSKQKLTNDLNVAEAASRRDAQAQKLAAQARTQASRSIQILGATYGYGANMVDVTERIRGEILTGNTNIHAGNHLASGDPFPGKVKTLTLTYAAGGGSAVTVRVSEGRSLSLLAPESSPVMPQRTEPQLAVSRPAASPVKSNNPLHQPARKHNPDGPKNPESDVY